MMKPSRLLAAVAILLWCALLGARAATPADVAVDSVGIPVSDMQRSRAFYHDVLGFREVADREVFGEPYEKLYGVFGVRLHAVRMQLGDEFIELMQFQAPRGRPLPVDSRSNDRWFQHVAIIVSDMDRAFARLEAAGVRHASTGGPQELPAWNPNAGGIKAFYFRDPDGHPLEILQFPAGKGLAKWHQPGDRLFLGIDHTAIVVRDTDRSLTFYRDALGLSVVGRSENYGPEQERLNAVSGARLRITALRGSEGPGIEFLEYLSPRDGRPYPRNERASDLVHWQTRVLVPDADAALSRLEVEGAPFVSPGAVALPPGLVAEGNTGLQVRDPDGHVVQLIAP